MTRGRRGAEFTAKLQIELQLLIHLTRTSTAGQGDRPSDIGAGLLIPARQAQQEIALIERTWIAGEPGHHLIAARDLLGQFLQLEIPETVIAAHLTLGKRRFPTSPQQQRKRQPDGSKRPKEQGWRCGSESFCRKARWPLKGLVWRTDHRESGRNRDRWRGSEPQPP